MPLPKFWCKRCDVKTGWYTRRSAIPCPFGLIWVCVECERENISPGDEDIKPKRRKVKARK